MNHGGDPYGILPPVPGLSFANVFSIDNAPVIAYLPFWPLITGLIYVIYSIVGLNDRFVYYFLLKQPAIFGDIGLAYLLYSYVSSRKLGDGGFWVLSFWLFSPFMIIISGIWGMFDSIAISFLMISAGRSVKLDDRSGLAYQFSPSLFRLSTLHQPHFGTGKMSETSLRSLPP